jgi:hypothetical protein
MRRLISRSLAAAAVLAGVATPLTLLNIQAGAQVVQGAESNSFTGYIIAIPPDNPGAAGIIGGGPITLDGVVSAKGSWAATTSLPGDPADSSRAIVAVPGGTYTLLITGGSFSFTSLNQSTCRYTGIFSDQTSTIVSGTGEFAAATGTFPTVNSSWAGYFPPAAGGGCNFNVDAASFNVEHGQGVGSINLHTP